MPAARYRGRHAVALENAQLRVTVLREGGHVAELLDKATGVDPLWTPPWPTIEPSSYDPARHPEYGGNVESPLLAGIMGHNLCLDLFGGPSEAEAACGMVVHGEASTAVFEISEGDGGAPLSLTMRAEFPLAAIGFERRLELHGAWVRFRETVLSRAATDRPIGWTQHVTLGPPFLQPGGTQVQVTATRSKTFETDFGSASDLAPGAEFDWPWAPVKSPAKTGPPRDLRVFHAAAAAGGYTAHLMDPAREHASFTAFSPGHRVAIGYIWRRTDFPWLGMWAENRSRLQPPWNGETVTWGLEFGVSPFPESRQAMSERGALFGVPTCRWLPARGRLEAEYWATVGPAAQLPPPPSPSFPSSLAWPAGPAWP
ncbi:MAG TPA: hypothetical protein VIC54_03860 [Terriglobales bacterium]|jgi:hypothetical protein